MQLRPQLTLWGDFVNDPGTMLAEELEGGRHPIIAVKDCRVGDFNGKTLSTLNSSTVQVDPDIPEAGHLRGWCVSLPFSACSAVAVSDNSSTVQVDPNIPEAGHLRGWCVFSAVSALVLGFCLSLFPSGAVTLEMVNLDNYRCLPGHVICLFPWPACSPTSNRYAEHIRPAASVSQLLTGLVVFAPGTTMAARTRLPLRSLTRTAAVAAAASTAAAPLAPSRTRGWAQAGHPHGSWCACLPFPSC